MKTVGVFFGGQSVEHDVSVITGVMTLNSIDREKYNPLPIYVDKEGVWYTGESLFDLDGFSSLNLKTLTRVCLTGGDNTLYAINKNRLKPIDKLAVAVNCMHGERGEDGSLSGVLSMNKIPLASPDILASSVCMDKRFTKIFLKGVGVRCLPSVYAEKEEDLLIVEEKLGFPVVVKPNKLGSSIGVTVAKDFEELRRAFLICLRYGFGAIIERKLENFIEINCAAYRENCGIAISECEKPTGGKEFLSFGDKYVSGKREFPANIERGVRDRIRKTTEKIYRELALCGVIRIDYFVVEKTVYVNEINTVPGSLAFYLFSNTMKGFSKMLNKMIELSLKRFAEQTTFITRFDSGILTGFGAKGSKHL